MQNHRLYDKYIEAFRESYPTEERLSVYSRQQRNGREEIAVELPRDYSGNAFSPFPPYREPPVSATEVSRGEERREAECIPEKKEECEECIVQECNEKDRLYEESRPPVLAGIGNLFGGNIGLEELLLLGVIFLIFTDEALRDSELIICLLLILFI